jgi:hypothetical protein
MTGVWRLGTSTRDDGAPQERRERSSHRICRRTRARREGFGAADACSAVGGRKPVGGAQRRVEEGHRWRQGRRSHVASRAVPTHLAATRRNRPCGQGPPRPQARVFRRRRKLSWRVAVDRCTRAGPGAGSAADPAGELRRGRGVRRRPCRLPPQLYQACTMGNDPNLRFPLCSLYNAFCTG